MGILLAQKEELKGILKTVYKQTGRALFDYQMITSGDKILLAFSGGEDSFLLLKILLLRKKRVPLHFTLHVVFVETPWSQGQTGVVCDFLSAQDVPFTVKPLIFSGKDCSCFWCSWNRRKIFFDIAEEFECNKIALGHNLDDIAQTTLMNLFLHGQISTMRPKQVFFNGKLAIIRPFSYIEKKVIHAAAEKMGFRPFQFVCPYAHSSKRKRIQEHITALEREFPNLKFNVFKSLRKENIREGYLL